MVIKTTCPLSVPSIINGLFAPTGILIILLQVTYRRKKLPSEDRSQLGNDSWWKFGNKKRRRQLVGTREEIEESSGLLGHTRT